ncbi:MAG TPA: lipid A deacylase LpxR family protein [Gammaproteobacteria bacterium]|nr:lipid A deacylase LpxR family protein [Gammaproteobacteria bacterium]
MKNKQAKYFYIVLVLLILASTANAALETELSQKSSDSFFSVQYENDLFSPDNRDHYYTSGIQFSMLKQEATPVWLEKIASYIPFYQKGNGINLIQYTLSQKMFTPDNIQISDLQVNDRPYAGYLYFSATVVSQISHSIDVDSGNQFELTLGIVGPSALAGEVQTFAHKLTKSPIPKGWHNQLNDELAIGLNYSRFSRYLKPISKNLTFGVTPQFSGSIGNVYTYGSVGVMFRLGNNLHHDLNPPNIRPGFIGTSYFKRSKTSSWYVYLGFEERMVLRNIFLDGNSFTQSHRVEKEMFISDIQYGIAYIFDDIRISLSSMTRSKEFTGQKEATNYGAINFTFRY